MTAIARVRDAVLAPNRGPIGQVLKTALAVSVAWAAAEALLRISDPIFAAIAALLVVQPSVHQSLGRAIERSFGVVAGVLAATGVTVLLGRSGWVVAIAITAVLLGAWLMRFSVGAANQAGITVVLVIALSPTNPQYPWERIVETVLGALVGVIVNAVVVPPVAFGPAHAATANLVEGVARSLEGIAEAFERADVDGERLLRDARQLHGRIAAAEAGIQRANESLQLNARAEPRHREVLVADADLVALLRPVVSQVIGMARTLCDLGLGPVGDGPLEARIALECRRAAHDVRALLMPVVRPTVAPEPAALTSPIAVPGRAPEHWVALGAVLEDLRRINAGLRGDAA